MVHQLCIYFWFRRLTYNQSEPHESYHLKVKAIGSHSHRVRSRVNTMFRLYQELYVDADPRAAVARPTPGVKREEVKLNLSWITSEKAQFTDYG